MATATTRGKIDYRLLRHLSDLVICSRCLRTGKVTPVPQIVSHRHTPRTLCRSCAQPGRDVIRRSFSRLVRL